MRSGEEIIKVAETEYARDATFGYTSSDLTDWVAEVTHGRIPPETVRRLSLERLRRGAPAVASMLAEVRAGTVVSIDAETDEDLRTVAVGVLMAEAEGRRFVYRCGPSFVRARLGQSAADPVDDESLVDVMANAAGRGWNGNGLVVVGSHVPTTSKQLHALQAQGVFDSVEFDIAALMSAADPGPVIERASTRVLARLETRPVVLHTSRSFIAADDSVDSLSVARRVSMALAEVVRSVLAQSSPSYIVAKGGITSSDVAVRGLQITRATVSSTLLPGIVSLWIVEHGPSAGLPYVVFAGNVGDKTSLVHVVDRLESARKRAHSSRKSDWQ